MVLAMLAGSWRPERSVLLWGGAAIACLMVLGYGLLWLRWKFHPAGGGSEGKPPKGLSIEDLESLRRKGLVNEAEFRRLRRVVLPMDTAEAQGGKSFSSVPQDVDDADDADDGAGEAGALRENNEECE